MTEREYENLFKSFSRDQLIKAAVRLALDTERLRKELDDERGVIR